MKLSEIGRFLTICTLGLLAVSCKKGDVECVVGTYQSASAEEKPTVLNAFLSQPSSECRNAYYAALESADEKDLPLFKTAFTSNDPCTHVVQLIDQIMRGTENEFVRAELIVRQGEQISFSDKQELEALTQVVDRKVNAQLESILKRLTFETVTAAMRSNPGCLAESARKNYLSEIFAQKMRSQLMLTMLAKLGEPGFNALLELNPKSNEETAFVSTAASYFGKDVVFPTLLQYEKGKKIAGIILLFHFQESESVYQRVIDAMQHGQFLKDADGGEQVVTVDDLKDRLGRWWGGLLRKRYAGNTQFARYAVYHMPPSPDVQLALLVVAANADLAFDYFTHKPPSALSSELIETLAYGLFEREAAGLSDTDRQQYFEKLFLASEGRVGERAAPGLPVTTPRQSLLFKIKHFNPEYQAQFIERYYDTLDASDRQTLLFSMTELPIDAQSRFYVSHFAKLMTEERRTVIFSIAKFTPLEKAKAFRQIRPLCKPDEAALVDFAAKSK